MRRLVVIAILLGGCTWFEDKPDRSCKTDSDCFQAQGEKCSMTTKQCVVPPDAGATP